MLNKKITYLFIYIFFLSSCGGGSSDPFAFISTMDSSVTIDEDTSYNSTFSATTNYKSKITYEIVTSTINGQSNITTSGNYSYQPNKDYFGKDNLSIKITAARLDGNNMETGENITMSLPVSITINPVNDPPSIEILDDLSAYSDVSLLFEDTLTVNVVIDDVDNEISELSFFGRIENQTILANLDIIEIEENEELVQKQNLIFDLSNVENAGLFNMKLCADDSIDTTCEGNLEGYFIANKEIKSVEYNCDDEDANCETSDQYFYYLIGNPSTSARTNYIFIGDQLNGIDEKEEFHLRLLESVNNLKNSDASEVFNDYFNVLVLEEVDVTGASIFNIRKGCYANWDTRIYCIGDINRGTIGEVVGDWNVVSFLTTLDGRGVAQGAVNIQPLSPRTSEIVQHELGHSHGFMGDEYDSRGERTFPSWYAEFTVNTTAVSDPSIVKWNHFIDDMTYVPGYDYDVCYNYPDGRIYYRDDIEYEDCECYFNTYDEDHPDYDPNYPGINDDNSCKDKVGLFQGTYYDEVDTYRPKWISVMWCCFLDYGKINVEGFAIGSITNQFNGFNDFIIKSDISDDVDLDNSGLLGEYITFDINGVFDTNKLKLSWFIDGIEQTELENQLVTTFNRPDDNKMTTYSWQVQDLTGNLIAPNDPLNPLDLYAGILNLYGGWSYYDPDPNTNPNNNPNYPYVGSWFWHKTDGNVDHDDTVDLSNLDNYLYAEQCCSLGYSYKINWKNYEPKNISTNIKDDLKQKNYFNVKPEVNNIEKIITLNISNSTLDIEKIQINKIKKEYIKSNIVNFRDKYILTFHDKDMNPIYNLGLGNPFESRLQHIGYEDAAFFNVEIPIKGLKVAFPKGLDPYFITYSKRSLNNTFEALSVTTLK